MNMANERAQLAAINTELERIVEERTRELSVALEENEYQLVKLSLIVEASNIGLWDMHVVEGDPLNPDNIFQWSDEFRQMLGYCDETDFPNILRSWSDKLHPDDKERTLDALAKHLLDKTGKTPYNIEYRLLKKNGEYGYFQAYGSTIRTGEGRALRVAGALKDITKEKQYREELEQLVQERTEEITMTTEELTATNEELHSANEEMTNINNELHRYQTQLEQMVADKTVELSSALYENEYQLAKLSLAVEASEIGLWDMFVVEGDPINPNNTFNWSDEFRQMLGYCGESDFPNILSSWSNKLHPDDKERTLDALAKHLLDQTGKTPYKVEYRLLKNNGEYGYFQACGSTIRNSEGRAIRVAGALKDIAKEKIAAEEMRQSQQILLKVFDSLNANISVYDIETSVILFANKGIKKMFGDIEGKLCWQILHKGMTGMCPFCPRKHILDENNQPTGIYRWEYRNDFDHKWYECHDVAIEWIDGRLVHLQQEIDINNSKHIQAELTRAKEKAEESDKLKSSFLANMSHEIRTPLNGILGFLNFLNYDNLSPKRRQEYMKIINNSSTQLTKIVDNIIDISKIDTQQMTLCPVPTKLNDLMNELFMFFNAYIQSNNRNSIELILDDSEFIDECVVYVDTARLRQVFNNLIDNAIKFTEKGYVRFGYRQSATDKLEFVVEDSGIGMSQSQLEVVFERFRKIESGNNTSPGGIGLGLPIVRSLIQMKGGDIWAESTEGSGSVFYFTIPYIPILPQNMDFFKNPPKEKPFTGNSVLIVEPVPLKFAYYKEFITATGATVINAENIKEWEDMVMKNPINLIFADISIFNSNDFDTILRIKTKSFQLPIAFFIPEKKEEYTQITGRNLCDTTIEAPIKYDDILKMMEECVF